MKISGSTSPGTLAGSRAGGRGAQPGFAPAAGHAAQAAVPSAHTGSLGALGSLDALLALQEAGGPTERRRRAVRRAGRLLDVLDEIKLALLEDGTPSKGALEQLRGAMREARQNTDDAKLEGVLDEIETRAAVELAKQEVARAA
jgi:hypothetical protein